MREFLCPVCKSPIVCSYETTDFYFYQDENDNIVRDTNEDPIYGIRPYYHFHCSNDKEDDIKPLDILAEFIEWKKEYIESIITILSKEGFTV